MKKVLSVLLILTFILALTGCAATSETAAADQSEKNAAQATAATSADTISEGDTADAQTSGSGGKTLVVYFSRSGEQYSVGVIEKGNTAIIADMIAEATGADTFEILPKTDNYPTTYKELTDYAKTEQANNERPEIASTVENFDDYDTVFLGYPIWWGDLPMICYTFLDSYDFSGKTVIPFCTHEGSGNAGTQQKLQSAIPGAEVKEVLAVKGSDAQNEQDNTRTVVTDWLSGMGMSADE